MPDWPHSPIHRLSKEGAQIITASTYSHKMLFMGRERLDYLCEALFFQAERFGWELQAWAILPNHYHFIAVSTERSRPLNRMVQRLHAVTSQDINREDGAVGRQVWFQYRDTELTYQKSFLARLNYVHYNPAHHGIVRDATKYRWCSASWFEKTTDTAFCKTIRGLKADKLMEDDIVCDGWEIAE